MVVLKHLHPKIHGGILARRGLDEAVMQEHNIDDTGCLSVCNVANRTSLVISMVMVVLREKPDVGLL